VKAEELLDELKWRGLIFQSTDEKSLISSLSMPTKFYCGFDPTAPSLHHGNLVQLILMRHLQNAGHIPFCIVGGATGLIGDPRQSGERILNDEDTVKAWVGNLTQQFKRFLSFDGDNAATVLNNFDWTASLSALDFLRDIGKNFRMGPMLAKDTVKTRLEDDGLSYTEFSYQVLQGYDYYFLNKEYGITLQTGGQDQWGNLTSGTDLIHHLLGNDHEAHVLTTPLITKADGTKFGKSEGGAIWLNPDMMSPYEFYQFWLNIEDSEVIKLMKVFTFLGRDEIEDFENQTNENPGARAAQRKLAEEVTIFVHGKDALDQAINASGALFGRGELSELSAQTLKSAISGVKQVDGSVGDKISELFTKAELTTSFGDFRRNFEAGGVNVNNVKLVDLNQELSNNDILDGDIVLLRKGKKTIAGVNVKKVEK
jgi:tyrosyl-tRNA synthetase